MQHPRHVTVTKRSQNRAPTWICLPSCCRVSPNPGPEASLSHPPCWRSRPSLPVTRARASRCSRRRSSPPPSSSRGGRMLRSATASSPPARSASSRRPLRAVGRSRVRKPAGKWWSGTVAARCRCAGAEPGDGPGSFPDSGSIRTPPPRTLTAAVESVHLVTESTDSHLTRDLEMSPSLKGSLGRRRVDLHPQRPEPHRLVGDVATAPTVGVLFGRARRAPRSGKAYAAGWTGGLRHGEHLQLRGPRRARTRLDLHLPRSRGSHVEATRRRGRGETGRQDRRTDHRARSGDPHPVTRARLPDTDPRGDAPGCARRGPGPERGGVRDADEGARDATPPGRRGRSRERAHLHARRDADDALGQAVPDRADAGVHPGILSRASTLTEGESRRWQLLRSPQRSPGALRRIRTSPTSWNPARSVRARTVIRQTLEGPCWRHVLRMAD